MSDQFENDELKLICDEGEVPDDVLAAEAPKIWAEIYGTPRASPAQPRVDTGVPRRGVKRKGEQAWISERRKSVREQVASTTTQSYLASGSTAGAIKHKFKHMNIKEAVFQKAKRLKHKFQAILDGSIDASQVSTQELQDVVKYALTLAKNSKKLQMDTNKRERIVNPVSLDIDINGKHVYYDIGVLDPACRAQHT